MKTFLKIYSCLIYGILVTVSSFAQGSTKEVNYEGLKVIIKRVPKEVVTASLFIRGGVSNINSDQQGIEPLALSLAVQGGTKKLDKNAFSALADKLGTNFNSSASKDYSSITMTCLKENWSQSWDMFTDAILNPAMDEQEFGVIKQQMIAAAKQTDANPDAYLRKIATQQIFKGTVYEYMQNGTPETLEKITLPDVKNYYAKLLGKKKCYLVVVGDIDEKDLLDKMKNTLAKLPEGTLPPKPVLAGVTKPEINISDRSIATNYIAGSVNAPKYFSPDGPLFEFAMRILYDRYFVELRTKRSLSYAPAAIYNKSQINSPTALLYISTIDPKQSLEVMTDIINDIKKNGFTAKEVEDKKKEYLTTYYMTNEASTSQANMLGFCEASGDWRIFDAINSKIDNVKTEDLNHVFDKYMNNIAWTYLGKKEKVTEEDFKQPVATKEKLPASKVLKQKKE
ncbi:MAG: insulinase family protein [Bacteroidetes bacterium]|nr:insulinase family protein [Bacteroidota bacterium]MBS1932995.1 insulinase family protein [Bacteroidota bacterium]